MDFLNINTNKKWKTRQTTHNRIVYAAPLWGLGSEKPQSGLALCGVFLRHIFTVAGMLTHSFIATVKTSYTTRTLDEIKI
jgi:hypothetical protein